MIVVIIPVSVIVPVVISIIITVPVIISIVITIIIMATAPAIVVPVATVPSAMIPLVMHISHTVWIVPVVTIVAIPWFYIGSTIYGNTGARWWRSTYADVRSNLCIGC